MVPALSRPAHATRPTRDYLIRRTKEGLSKREIIRCLKRYIAREVYRVLPGTASAIDQTARERLDER